MTALAFADDITLRVILGQLYSYLHPASAGNQRHTPRSDFVAQWLKMLQPYRDLGAVRRFYEKSQRPEREAGVAFAFLMQQATAVGATVTLSRYIEDSYDEHAAICATICKPSSYQNDLQQLVENCKDSLDIGDCSPDFERVSLGLLFSSPEVVTDAETPQEYTAEDIELPSVEVSSPLPETRSVSRRIAQGQSVLRCFFRFSRTKMMKAVKKEYFRMQHIRALKKSIRQIASGKRPSLSIHRFSEERKDMMDAWNSLKLFYKQQRHFLKQVSAVCQKYPDGERSFNNTFCREFFSSGVTQQYHMLYCDLVYISDAREMCKKMRILCCSEDSHSQQCAAAWQDLKYFTKFEMLEEVGVCLCPEAMKVETEVYLAINAY